MSQQAGSDLDNVVANGVHEHTSAMVTGHSMRGSGNLRTPQPDVMVRTAVVDYAIELKRNSRTDRGDRAEFINKEDLEQLTECANDYTEIYVGLKMTNCQMVCVRVDPENPDESIAENLPEAFDANATRSGNVTVRKPRDTDVWPSATAGKSKVEVVCDAIGVKYYD